MEPNLSTITLYRNRASGFHTLLYEEAYHVRLLFEQMSSLLGRYVM